VETEAETVEAQGGQAAADDVTGDAGETQGQNGAASAAGEAAEPEPAAAQ
jgi:hypothetical protein